MGDYICRKKALEKARPVSADDIGAMAILCSDLASLPSEKVVPAYRCVECVYHTWKPDPVFHRPDSYCKYIGRWILDDNRHLCQMGKVKE